MVLSAVSRRPVLVALAQRILTNLQARQKWTKIQPNLAIDNIMLVYDQAFPRRKWPMGKVMQIFPEKSRRVRQVPVRTQFNALLRPVTKLGKFLP